MFSSGGRLSSPSLVPLRRTSWSNRHANREYVGISGPARVHSAHRVRKFSLNFHRVWRSAAGRNWLPVLRSAVSICPRAAGRGRRRGPACVPDRKLLSAVDLGNARISHWSFRRVTRFESRSCGAYKYTGCPIVTFYNARFFQHSPYWINIK